MASRWTKVVFDVLQFISDRDGYEIDGSVKPEVMREFQDFLRNYTTGRCKYIARKAYKPFELNYYYLLIKCKLPKDAVLFRMKYSEYTSSDFPQAPVRD